MINEIICFKCKCSKCGHRWTTKSHDLPKVCSACKRVTWNDDQETAPTSLAPTNEINVYPQQHDALADFIAKAQAKKGVTSEVVMTTTEQPRADEWIFTKDKPEFNDNGRVYRQQYLVDNPKQRRTVRVDEEDHDSILSVGK